MISNAQFVSLNPSGAGAADEVTITFDANQGNKELVGADKVYMHHGVVTDKALGTAWKYVKGNWGKDDGIGLMTKVAGAADKWQITFKPSVRAYYGVPNGENIFRISCVFRSADGSIKGTLNAGEYGWGSVATNGDIYINLDSGDFINFRNPATSESFLTVSESLQIQVDASAEVTSFKLFVNAGSGFGEVLNATSGKAFSYSYQPTMSGNILLRAVAVINGVTKEIEKEHNIIIKKSNTVRPLPQGLKSGANYENDPTKVTLVLLAPKKQFVYAVGDFTDWKLSESNQMNITPDGEYFWIQLSGLTPGKQYVYQYWIDGNLKIADPYTQVVADPYNDKFISSSVFPSLPVYNREDLGIASVFRTSQTQYVWSPNEAIYKRPDVNHLVIYELHIRDFIASHSYQDMIDTISYLKRLGINAIELMPVNEFEGNDSWGYNPSFYFAVDKYYGTKDKLKEFIDVAHQNGMAVIIDMVLNHSFGQGPMVQMYFDRAADKPTADNPWFNQNHVGPFAWGYDFNHESAYTKKFIDDVNKYWIEEFHFDGFRFDFTKGMTNFAPGGNIDGFDQSRINILNRMANEIWKIDRESYITLEHWSGASEEGVLGNAGMKMWRNKSYDFVPATVGKPIGSFVNTDALTHVTFYNSHDERRIAEHCLAEGLSQNGYNIKDSVIMYERVKMAAAFTYLQPGPKMIWQFDELGYDIDINFNGRTGRKPYVWGNGSLRYYESGLRQNIYKTYQGILNIRNTITPQLLAAAQINHQHSGDTRRLSYNTSGTDLVVIGNFAMSDKTVDPKFTQTGMWYNYFSGDSVNVTNVTKPIALKAGEWHIYTNKRLAPGQKDVVKVYDNPVTVSPTSFTGSDRITITFDAKKADPKGSLGLVGADKVYMHSGVVLSSATNSNLTSVVGSGADDGIGQLTSLGNDLWSITLTPNAYFAIAADKEIYQLGMWFRNADNTKLGYGFRGSIIYLDVRAAQPIVTISPTNFTADTEVTITFDARQGNRELVGADKIYMHSGVGIVKTNDPAITAWNNVVGNWGSDDGKGLMTKVPGTVDKWQIKLTPKAYYGINSSDVPYWIAAVFRSRDGNTKGTIAPGSYENILVNNNQDYFIRNERLVSVEEGPAQTEVRIYPNPTTNLLVIDGIEGQYSTTIKDMAGSEVFGNICHNRTELDISLLPSGIYMLSIVQGSRLIQEKIVVTR